MRRSIVAGAVAVGLLLAGCTGLTTSVTSAPPARGGADAPPGLDTYYGQQLAWRSCGTGFDCAQLRVPKDYDDPAGGGDFAVQVIRLRAENAKPIGSLVLNPGGPGGSGVDYGRAARSVVSDDVRRLYDVVGFDPRGVAGSDPVTCLTDEETDLLLEADPTPDTADEVQTLTARAATVGRQCLDRSPDIAPWMDTRSTAKDLDILRAALGDDRLNYLGKSYGTAIGAVYAEQFPRNVGRMVLDGALPVSLTSEQVSLGQAEGFERALQRFVQDCIGRADCPLSATTDQEGVVEIQRFLASLETDPMEVREGEALTEALASAALLYYLYFPPEDWRKLREGLLAAYDEDGSVLLNMLYERLQRNQTTGRYANNAQDAFYAVSCLDRPASSLADVEDREVSWSQLAPTFGPYLAWSDAVCAQWPITAVSRPRSIAAVGAGPILVVSAQNDPATPYEWGEAMAQEFDDAVLVSSNSDAHTSYRRGSRCVDDVVDAYLIAGDVPAEDPRCGY